MKGKKKIHPNSFRRILFALNYQSGTELVHENHPRPLQPFTVQLERQQSLPRIQLKKKIQIKKIEAM